MPAPEATRPPSLGSPSAPALPPGETGAPPARYGFSPTIKVTHYGGRVLLWDPPTGSWCFLDDDVYTAVQALKGLCDARRYEDVPTVAAPVLEELHASGLVSREGRYVWSRRQFEHQHNPVNTVILKVVGACNLACTYCYDYNSSRFGKKMTLETARQAIDGVWDRSADALNVLFHGGEPMLAKDLLFTFVPEVARRAEESGKEVYFSIQTNGTRFTDDWCEFLSRYRFSVGVSLDGPAELSDANRVNHAGRGTYDRIVELLCRYDLIDKVGVLTTVTRHNVDHLLEVALHFQELGVQVWDTTLFQSAGRGAGREDDFEPPLDALIASYLALLEGVERGLFPTMEVRSVMTYIRNLLSYKRTSMCMRSSCGAGSDLISISVDGAIEACDCIAEPTLRIGRLEGAASIGEALDSPTAQAIRSRHVDKLAPCHRCDWRVVCGGSCLAKAGKLDGVVESECRLSLALFPAIFESLAESDRLVDYVGRFA